MIVKNTNLAEGTIIFGDCMRKSGGYCGTPPSDAAPPFLCHNVCSYFHAIYPGGSLAAVSNI